ncbi:MAG: hypothetical protein IPJ65_37740 [Archangiaceae bacterium]|nr:hypothetical protein [Archangiaceae bacterium]
MPPSRRRVLFEIATVGLPFCVFKVATGLVLLPRVPALGWALIALGVADAVLNVSNAGGVAFTGRRAVPVCLLEAVLSRRRELGTALDVGLAFALVATMVGFGLLRELPATALQGWDAAVVLNVLGAGALRVVSALRARGP